jgi:tripartite-type tricarboxylate transporter receptor subunit TctC
MSHIFGSGPSGLGRRYFMKVVIKCYLAFVFAIALLAATAVGTFAQGYPTKPVRVVVTYPPGSGVDIATRLIAAKLSSALGRQFIVDNRSGASGHIGTEIVAHAVPDGYTLASATIAITIGPALYPKLGYNIEKDLDPIVLLTSAPYILVVHPSLPAKNVMELVALAKSKPGGLNYASTGKGGVVHLATEMFKMQAKVNIMHVPYKSTPSAVTDLLSEQVQMMFANSLSVLPMVRAGKLRALAIASSKRSEAVPELPTFAEAGMPGFEAGTWFGMLAPSGTPKDIIAHLNGEVRKILQMPDVRELLKSQGADPIGSTPEEFRDYIKSQIVTWKEVVKATGVRIE